MKLKTHRFELVLNSLTCLARHPKMRHHNRQESQSCRRTEKIIYFQEFAADKENLWVK
jgi:hypothetical protein